MDRLTPDRPLSTWHALLDGVESDVERTENWLVMALADANGPGVHGDAPAPIVLPEFGGARPVPSELLVRITALRERMLRLSTDLERAMADNRRQRAALPTLRPPTPDRPAFFVDRSV